MTRVTPYQNTLYMLEIAEPARSPLVRFVVLSMLLHTWLVLMFADASRPGERNTGVLWGQINVALKKLSPTPAPTDAPPLKMSTELGNISRPAPARPAPSRPKPVEPIAALREVLRDTPPVTATPVEQPLVQKPVEFKAAPLAPLPTARAEPLPSVPEATVRMEAPASAPMAPIAVPTVEPRPLALPETAERVAPVITAPLTPMAPATARTIDVPPEASVRVEPPASRPLETLKPAQPQSAPAALPEPTTRVEVPADTARPLQQLTPTAPQTLRSESLEPATRLEAPAAQPLQPMAPAQVERPINRMPDDLPTRVDVPRTEPLAPIPSPVQRPINRLSDAPVAPFGTQAPVPDASSSLPSPLGRPSDSAPALKAAPRLDLDSLRQRAREITADGNTRNSLFAGPKLPPKNKEQEIFDKALKEKDCKNAYADMGLLAIAPLIASALAEERKCKW